MSDHRATRPWSIIQLPKILSYRSVYLSVEDIGRRRPWEWTSAASGFTVSLSEENQSYDSE